MKLYNGLKYIVNWLSPPAQRVNNPKSLNFQEAYCQHCNNNITKEGGMLYSGKIFCYTPENPKKRPTDELPCAQIMIPTLIHETKDPIPYFEPINPMKLQLAIKENLLKEYEELNLESLL